jgi:hypothetical protein
VTLLPFVLSGVHVLIMLEEFEDTKGVIRSRKSKKDKQHNGQKKKEKWTDNDI